MTYCLFRLIYNVLRISIKKRKPLGTNPKGF
ncbi:hypothetical protein HMPREF1000_03787, partial [Parabacteroides sp. D26]